MIAVPFAPLGAPSARTCVPNTADIERAQQYSDIIDVTNPPTDGEPSMEMKGEGKCGDDCDDKHKKKKKKKSKGHDDEQDDEDDDEDDDDDGDEDVDEHGDPIDEAVGLTDINKLIASMMTSPKLAARLEQLVKRSGATGDDARQLANQLREALTIHMSNSVPLALRDVGIDIGKGRASRAERGAKAAAKGGTMESDDVQFDRLLQELTDEIQVESRG